MGNADDMIWRQAAIKEFDSCELTPDGGIDVNYAIDFLNQLPPAQPEQTDCEYCHEDFEGYVKPIEKNGHAFVCFGMGGWELSLQAKGWHGGAKIRFCPMCGRDLLVK